jgi:hypothetical protein
MAVFGRTLLADAYRSCDCNTGCCCCKAVDAKTALERRLAFGASTRHGQRSRVILVLKLIVLGRQRPAGAKLGGLGWPPHQLLKRRSSSCSRELFRGGRGECNGHFEKPRMGAEVVAGCDSSKRRKDPGFVGYAVNGTEQRRQLRPAAAVGPVRYHTVYVLYI